MERGIERLLVESTGFLDITNLADVMDWLHDRFMPTLFVDNFYNGAEVFHTGQNRTMGLFYVGPVLMIMNFYDGYPRNVSGGEWSSNGLSNFDNMYCADHASTFPADTSHMLDDPSILRIFRSLPCLGKVSDITNDGINLLNWYGSDFKYKVAEEMGNPQEGYHSLTLSQIKLTDVLEEISFLRNMAWLDHRAASLRINVYLYNYRLGLHVLAEFRLPITDGGVVEPALRTISFPRSTDYWSQPVIQTALEFLFIASLFWSGYMSIKSILKMGMKAYWADLWNYLDVLHLGLSALCVAMWIAVLMECSEVDFHAFYSYSDYVIQPADPEYSRIYNALTSTRTMKTLLEVYTYLTNFNIAVLFARILRFLSFQRRLAVFNRTIEIAAVALFQFTLVTAFLFLGFALAGHFTFGHRSDDFSSLETALETCFLYTFQVIGPDDIIGVEGGLPAGIALARLWHVIFMMAVGIIIINVFIAIILAAYEMAKLDGDNGSSVHGDFLLAVREITSICIRRTFKIWSWLFGICFKRPPSTRLKLHVPKRYILSVLDCYPNDDITFDELVDLIQRHNEPYNTVAGALLPIPVVEEEALRAQPNTAHAPTLQQVASNGHSPLPMLTRTSSVGPYNVIRWYLRSESGRAPSQRSLAPLFSGPQKPGVSYVYLNITNPRELAEAFFRRYDGLKDLFGEICREARDLR